MELKRKKMLISKQDPNKIKFYCLLNQLLHLLIPILIMLSANEIEKRFYGGFIRIYGHYEITIKFNRYIIHSV